MTPLPEICKECRHQKSMPGASENAVAFRCLVWGHIALEDETRQFFESREKPLHFQQLRSWVKRFEEVEGK